MASAPRGAVEEFSWWSENTPLDKPPKSAFAYSSMASRMRSGSSQQVSPAASKVQGSASSL